MRLHNTVGDITRLVPIDKRGRHRHAQGAGAQRLGGAVQRINLIRLGRHQRAISVRQYRVFQLSGRRRLLEINVHQGVIGVGDVVLYTQRARAPHDHARQLGRHLNQHFVDQRHVRVGLMRTRVLLMVSGRYGRSIRLIMIIAITQHFRSLHSRAVRAMVISRHLARFIVDP